MFIALVGSVNANLPPLDIWDDAHDVPWDPDNPVFDPVEKVELPELLEAVTALTTHFKDLLDVQHKAGRITNADFAKTFVGLSQVAMGGAVQFVLGKDQAYWMAVKTQADAITAKNQNELARMNIMVARAQFASLKLGLASTDSQFGVSEVNRMELLPAQVNLTKEQHEGARAQTLDTRVDGSSISGQLGAQKQLTMKQTLMVHEQMEAQRAQTLDARQDGMSRATTVTLPDGTTETRMQGLLGVQNFLYRQQIISYRDDSKVKAGKLFSDIWMTMKTIDDGTQPSDYFRPPTNVEPSTPLDGIFKTVRDIATGNTNPWTP